MGGRRTAERVQNRRSEYTIRYNWLALDGPLPARPYLDKSKGNPKGRPPLHQLFHTSPLSGRDRQERWKLHNSQLFPGLSFRGHGSGLASADDWNAGDVSLIRYRCYPHDVVQAAPQRCLKLFIPNRTGTTYSDGHSRVTVSPGDLVIYDMNAPYAITNACDVDHLLVHLPQSLVHPQGRQEGALGKRSFYHFGRDSGLGRLLADFITSTFSIIEQLNETELQVAGETISRLLRSTLDDVTERSGASSSSLQYIYTRAVRIIDESLRDHELTVDELVRKLNCCRRSLYASFEGSGLTPKEMILSKRLEGVRHDLRKHDLRGRTILEIIGAWGFEEQKSFCRIFKTRYGITAGAYRNMGE